MSCSLLRRSGAQASFSVGLRKDGRDLILVSLCSPVRVLWHNAVYVISSPCSSDLQMTGQVWRSRNSLYHQGRLFPQLLRTFFHKKRPTQPWRYYRHQMLCLGMTASASLHAPCARKWSEFCSKEEKMAPIDRSRRARVRVPCSPLPPS